MRAADPDHDGATLLRHARCRAPVAAPASLLDLADIGFVAGVALIAITGLLPRRPERETAGR